MLCAIGYLVLFQNAKLSEWKFWNTKNGLSPPPIAVQTRGRYQKVRPYEAHLRGTKLSLFEGVGGPHPPKTLFSHVFAHILAANGATMTNDPALWSARRDASETCGIEPVRSPGGPKNPKNPFQTAVLSITWLQMKVQCGNRCHCALLLPTHEWGATCNPSKAVGLQNFEKTGFH